MITTTPQTQYNSPGYPKEYSRISLHEILSKGNKYVWGAGIQDSLCSIKGSDKSCSKETCLAYHFPSLLSLETSTAFHLLTAPFSSLHDFSCLEDQPSVLPSICVSASISLRGPALAAPSPDSPLLPSVPTLLPCLTPKPMLPTGLPEMQGSTAVKSLDSELRKMVFNPSPAFSNSDGAA